MQVKDIMVKEVVTVDPETRITEVAKILFENRFHGVPVVKDGEIVGIITETDFFTKDSENFFLPSYIKFLEKNVNIKDLSGDQQGNVAKLFGAKATDIMSKNCTTIFEDMKLEDLLEFFKTTKFTTLPVVDEKNSLVGIVTVSDIINLIKV